MVVSGIFCPIPRHIINKDKDEKEKIDPNRKYDKKIYPLIDIDDVIDQIIEEK